MWSYLFAGFGMLSNLVVLQELFLLLWIPFGVHHYTITGERDTVRQILRTLQTDGVSLSRRINGTSEYPSKICIGRRFLAWIDTDSLYIDTWVIRIVCSKDYYTNLMRDPTPTQTPALPQPTTSQVLTLVRRGGMDDFRYRRVGIDLSDTTPKGDQQRVIDSILNVYRKTRVARIFLHGPPGTGKSAVGLLLARELRGSYCHTFDPTIPGDDLYNVLGTHQELEVQGPCIVVLEEANELIHKIHAGLRETHVKQVTAIRDKPSWCTFLDDLVFSKNVIVILTSNQPPSELDALDPAYLRPNRIDLQLEMTTPVYPS